MITFKYWRFFRIIQKRICRTEKKRANKVRWCFENTGAKAIKTRSNRPCARKTYTAEHTHEKEFTSEHEFSTAVNTVGSRCVWSTNFFDTFVVCSTAGRNDRRWFWSKKKKKTKIKSAIVFVCKLRIKVIFLLFLSIWYVFRLKTFFFADFVLSGNQKKKISFN